MSLSLLDPNIKHNLPPDPSRSSFSELYAIGAAALIDVTLELVQTPFTDKPVETTPVRQDELEQTIIPRPRLVKLPEAADALSAPATLTDTPAEVDASASADLGTPAGTDLGGADLGGGAGGADISLGDE